MRGLFTRHIKALGKKRFVFMFLLPLAFALLMWAVRSEASDVRINHIEIKKDAFRHPFDKPLRVLHISDLHLNNAAAVTRLYKALQLALPASPDLAILSGDFGFPYDERDFNLTLSYLQILSQAMPTFACMGNHDYYGVTKTCKTELARLLAAANIPLLQNESRTIIVNGQHLTIAGLADCWVSEPRPDECLSPLADAQSDNHVLLLDHNPDHLLELKDYDWDLAFSGHAHGGQFTPLGLNWRPFAPVKNKWLAEPGLHSIFPQRFLSESAGLGNQWEIRFFCKPDIVILDIR